MTFLSIALRGLVCGMLIATAASAQDKQPEPAPWQAGFATLKITPTKPVLLAGYASRTDPSREVAGDLYLKALALDDGRGAQGRAVLITADLIGFRKDITEEVAARIMQKTGLRREQLLFNASHTHSGPDLSIDADDAAKSEGHANTHQFIQQFKDQVVQVVDAALADMKPARLSWATGVCSFVMNRREFTPTGVKLGVNPRGYVDRSVPVLRVEGADGRLRGVVFGYACHNTTLTGQNYAVHGDYAGEAQQHIEAAQPGVVAMFMLGCAGDANPHPRNTLENAKDHGRELGTEVLRVLDGKFDALQPPLRTALQYVDIPLKQPPTRDKLDEIARNGASYEKIMASRMIVELEKGNKLQTHYHAPVAAWQFGNGLTLIGLPGETTSGYIRLTEQELGPRKLWIAGYCNDVFGYLPTADVLREGGYETRGLYWGGLGVFAENAQDVVQDAVGDVARQAGREQGQ